ncbi:MAG: ABC transporter permease [Bacteroidota bacterium]
MLRNYFLTALRAFRREKGYAFINVAGLAVGLACAALIFGYVRLEQSFDDFHERGDRTVRVVQQQPGSAFMGRDRFAVTPASLGRALREEAPEVEAAATLGSNPNTLLIAGEQRLIEDGLWTDGHFFEVFSFPLLRGDPQTALADPEGLVLTETLAQKLFGTADPLGEAMEVSFFDSLYTYTVTGIAADVPANSHLQFSYLRALGGSPDYRRNEDNWVNSGFYSYAVLRPDVTTAAFDERVGAIYGPREELDEGEEPTRLYAQPLGTIHLRSDLNFDPAEQGDARLVALFSAIALVILLLACVNYTNLAVARSAQRAREVGMRKVAGATRGQIMTQHLAESVLTALAALGLGLGLAWLALPLFESWMERDLGPVVFSAPSLFALAGLAVVVGLAAGLYPAVVLTGMQPTRVLKGLNLLPAGRLRLRSLLVVGQYASALVLVIGSLVIYRQLDFVQSRPLGFEREHIVALDARDLDADAPDTGRSVWSFKQEVERLPGVVGVAASSHLPTTVGSQTILSSWTGREGSGDDFYIYQTQADSDFLELYDMALVAGRPFTSDVPTDTVVTVILNETAVRALGWTPADAVGRTLGNEYRGRDGYTVIGVVRDFHLHSMHRPIEPLMLVRSDAWIRHLAVRIRPERMPETLDAIGASWQTFSVYPFEYQFLDERFDRLYADERRLGEGVIAFTLVALFIACLGLFGLAAFTAQRRTKEVGIRKALGASVGSLVGLLSKDFLKLVLVSLVVAAPVAYLLMSRWLDAFAYRIELGPGLFLGAGVLAVAVALLAVSGQALRAASVDPVKALRYE